MRACVQVVCVLNLVFTVLWYVKGISALRRLATSEYHLHPDELTRRQRYCTR